MNPKLIQNVSQHSLSTASHNEHPGDRRHNFDPQPFVFEHLADIHEKSGSLNQQFVQPISAPIFNRYKTVTTTTQRPAVQHVPFDAGEFPAESLDSSGSSLNSDSASGYSHSLPSITTKLDNTATLADEDASAAPISNITLKERLGENMTDYRLQSVSALCSQPPPGLPPSMQSSGGVIPGSTGMMARGDGYHVHYAPTRNMFPNTNNVAMNLPRYSHYPPTRPIDMNSNAHNGALFGATGGYLYDPPPRQNSANPEAPPFYETTALQHLLINNQTVRPDIKANIHKGFFQVDSKWTCYRRNYFSLTCSFTLRPWVQTQNSHIYLQLSNGTTARVKSFAMAISAVVNGQENETRELVQHTPKRDKQSERRPGRISLEPQPPSSLIPNPGHVSNSHHMAFAVAPPSSMHFDCGSTFGGGTHGSQTVQSAPTSHTFERIQFQKATANNGKRRAQQQFYQLVTELYVDISDSSMKSCSPQWVLIARKLSYPMVVRGRSPGHYKDNARRDSTTSLGPDSDLSNSGDGRLGSLSSGMTQPSRPHPPLLSSYEPAPNRRMTSSDQPPLTANSLVSSSSSSPGFDFSMMNESMNPMETMKDTGNVDAYGHQTFAASSAGQRKIEPSGLRNHIPPFNDGGIATTKSQDHHDGTFGESFEPMVPLLHNDNDGSNQYGMKFHGSYSHRPGTNGFGRF